MSWKTNNFGFQLKINIAFDWMGLGLGGAATLCLLGKGHGLALHRTWVWGKVKTKPKPPALQEPGSLGSLHYRPSLALKPSPLYRGWKSSPSRNLSLRLPWHPKRVECTVRAGAGVSLGRRQPLALHSNTKTTYTKFFVRNLSYNFYVISPSNIFCKFYVISCANVSVIYFSNTFFCNAPF